jgi:hypothetical protein
MKGDLNIDFTMAIILFISVYAMLYILLPSATISFKKTPDPLQTASTYFADVLTVTPGIPANWSDLGTVTKLGLAYGSNVTSYPNIFDVNKILAINGQACSSLKPKTDMLLDFAIKVDCNTCGTGINYSCTGTIPTIARLIERVGYIKNGSTYTHAKLQVWTW